jgi:ABC-2 type transport system ATP-binding protein
MSAEEPAIELRGLTKLYGERLAVDNLSMSVARGDIFGFVGPNGAGKTSTIRMIAGLLRPTSGDVLIDGFSVTRTPQQVKRQIGYMPDFFGQYPNLKVWEYLDFFAACYNIPEAQRSGLINELLELVDLSHRREDLVDLLSHGMKQRLSLARTLVNDPQVLLLDEPASGLDPRARVEIRELLVELARMGKTVFFSTHILADVAEICTRVGIIEAGRLVAVDKLESLHLQIISTRKIEITLLDKVQEAQEVLDTFPNLKIIQVQPAQDHAAEDNQSERSRLWIETGAGDAELVQVLAALVDKDIPVLHFSEDNRDLEEIFLRATRGLVT